MKYRPVEGRSITEVKVGEVASSHSFGNRYEVIFIHQGEAWLKGLGALTLTYLEREGYHIVEPAPEPKIEVCRELIFFNGKLISRLCDVTYTDCEPTAVELLKD